MHVSFVTITTTVVLTKCLCIGCGCQIVLPCFNEEHKYPDGAICPLWCKVVSEEDGSITELETHMRCSTLQDCWLLSALSILAGENGTIESLFVRHSINGHLMQGDRIEPTDASYHMIRFYHSERFAKSSIIKEPSCFRAINTCLK